MSRSLCLVGFFAFLASSCATRPSITKSEDQNPKAQDNASNSVHAASAVQDSQNTKPTWTRIPGTPGADPRYGSGFLDLASLATFAQGEKLRLRIGGTAEKVVVRLLPAGQNPSEAVGIIDTFAVPKDRVLVLTLESEHPNVRQVSVHGGPRPWDLYDLGGGNGPATLLSADRAAR